MNKTFMIIFFSSILLIVVYYLFSFYAVSTIFDSGIGKSYSEKDLIDNYEKNSTRLFELQKYYTEIAPINKVVEIEFENDAKIARFDITNLNSPTNEGKYISYSDLSINSLKLDSLTKSFGWTKATLTEIKLRLDKANCISIENGEPTRIGFQRSGFGMYFYDLFQNSIPDSERNHYNDNCTHILYSNKVVLEYGGGVYGPQCFSKQ